MTRPLLIVPCAVAWLAACGSGSSSAHSVSSGTYAVSSATSAQASDACGLLGAYQDASKQIGITVSGTTVTFNLANDPSAASASLPRAIIEGNTIGQAIEANYTVAFTSSCVVRVHRSVTGDVTADDEVALTLTFSAATDSGTCDPADSSFATLPCTSSYHFLAKKVQ